MKASKEFLKNKGYLPRISFEKGKPRIVQVIDDKPESITDKEGKTVEGIKYKVVEEGIPKTIFTSSFALIGKLSELEPEETVKITQKGYQQDGQWRTTYEVSKMKDGSEEEISDNDDIPVVDEDEPEPKKVDSTDDGHEIDSKDLPF